MFMLFTVLIFQRCVNIKITGHRTVTLNWILLDRIWQSSNPGGIWCHDLETFFFSLWC